MLGYFIAFSVGAIWGVVVICCFMVIKCKDKQIEELNKNNNVVSE